MRVGKVALVGLQGLIAGLLVALVTVVGAYIGGWLAIALAHGIVGDDALSFVALAAFFLIIGVPVGAGLAFWLAVWCANLYFVKPS